MSFSFTEYASYEVVFHINMFRPLSTHWVRAQCYGTMVVGMNFSTIFVIQVISQVGKIYALLASGSWSNVFSLTSCEGDC